MTYTVANAAGSATGQIRVIPVPAPLTPQPPVASDISVTVRAGDAVTIPISKYATDPTGQLLTVKPFPDGTLPADQGLVFATESAIRYLGAGHPTADHRPVQLHGRQHRPAHRHPLGDHFGRPG